MTDGAGDDPAPEDGSDPGDRETPGGVGDGDPGRTGRGTPGRGGDDDPGRGGDGDAGTLSGGDGDRRERAADAGRGPTPGGGDDGRGPPPGGSAPAGGAPPPAPGADAGDGEDRSVVVQTLREAATSFGLVVVVGLLLFALSGIWPPLVAVESGSMEPHMFKGDLVFVVEDGRYAPTADANDTGVVTHRIGQETGYWSFGNYGNVVVYRPDGREGTPIIHRARFYVEEGENWVAQANPEYTGGATCARVRTCPAPHDGFITKGDNNRLYDQVAGRSTVVKPEWIRGVAKVRAPYLGCIRLQLAGDSCFA